MVTSNVLATRPGVREQESRHDMATRNRPRQAGATRPRASRRASLKEPKEILLPPRNDFPVVGLGASAGGLEAVSKLLDALPADGGMAFILIQHLDPTH